MANVIVRFTVTPMRLERLANLMPPDLFSVWPVRFQRVQMAHDSQHGVRTIQPDQTLVMYDSEYGLRCVFLQLIWNENL